MPEIILFIGLSLSTCTITAYQSVKGQTDESPNFTSIGERTHKGGVAISRDLLKRWGGPCNYGDYVYIEYLGIYKINDCMGSTQYDKVNHKRVSIHHHFDIWVSSLNEEKQIKMQLQKVYLIKKVMK